MNSDENNSSFSIENKVFLVTGGAAGVGAGIARALLSENALVSHKTFQYRPGILISAEYLSCLREVPI